MVSYKTNPNKSKVFAYSITLAMLALLVPIASYQEDPNAVSNANSTTGIGKIVRISGIDENSFVPNITYIGTNQALTFINMDGNNGGTAHSVVSAQTGTTSPDGTFESGLIKTGQSFKVSFDEPGIYEYFDSIYPHIRGTIHVI